MSDSDETTSVNSDTNDRFYDPEAEHTHDPPAVSTSSSSSSSTTTIPSSAIAALTALNTRSKLSRPPLPAIPTTSTPIATPRPSSSQITIALHFRLGVPLQRSRSRKHIPPPVHFELLYTPPPSFATFMSLLRTQTDTVPRCHWPTGSRAYLQPAHSSSQWQYVELTPGNFVEKLKKAWRNESKRCTLSTKGEQAAAHVYVYLVEEEEDWNSPAARGLNVGKEESADHEEDELEEETREREREQETKEREREQETKERERKQDLERERKQDLERERARDLEREREQDLEREREQDLEREREQDLERVRQHQGRKRRVEEVNNGEGSSSSSSSYLSAAARSGSGLGSGPVLSFLSKPGASASGKNTTTATTTTTTAMRSPLQARAGPSRRRIEEEEHEVNDEDDEEEEFRTIRLRVNGTVVNYEIELRSLREALGLALLGDGSSKRRRT
ncbi:hypothetical protein BGZ82_007844 [Podila clonocystis]|nr:hypothetical protein BGZ82_007844 [Podila clonocystis]